MMKLLPHVLGLKFAVRRLVSGLASGAGEQAE